MTRRKIVTGEDQQEVPAPVVPPQTQQPPYRADRQRILLGHSDGLAEVRLGDEDHTWTSRYPTVLVAGRPGSGRLMLLLQIVHQQRQLDKHVTYLSFRKDRSLTERLGGIGMDRVTLTPELLRRSPGALDPMLFSDRFTRAGDILTAAIANLLRLRHHGGGREQFLRWALLQREARAIDATPAPAMSSSATAPPKGAGERQASQTSLFAISCSRRTAPSATQCLGPARPSGTGIPLATSQATM